MRTPVLALALLVALGTAACVGQQDDPTSVHDLRVLGLSFDPPELMIPGCDPKLLLGLAAAADGGVPTLDPLTQLKLAIVAATPLRFSALIADPEGNARTLDYRLLACANTTDRRCANEGDFVELADGGLQPGDVAFAPMLLATKVLDDGTDAGTLLPLEVVQQDTFKGLGGIRIPVVLDLSAPDTQEHIYAQKLMVYSCGFFPSQKPNVLARLPGILFEGEPWPESEVKELVGHDGVSIQPEDFSALQEPYVLPSLTLQPVSLVETWKLNFTTTFGTFRTYELGGTGFDGVSERYTNKWSPPPDATEPHDVTMHFVVRDGRGGETWLLRHAHWSP